ncbi:hypothetical protein ES705_23809 [subsurface metagenome]
MINISFCDLFQLNSFEHSLLLAPYVPLDGINEKGLIITMLSIQEESVYPSYPNKITVGDFNIIRIILDNCKNVDEAIEEFNKYCIIQTGPLPIHYLVADRQKSCTSIRIK